MNIAITGASGMLGTALINNIKKKFSVFATSRLKGLHQNNVIWSCFDLNNFTDLESWLHNVKPDVLIHCAAIVNVDECESNADLAYHLHVKTTDFISNYCHQFNTHLIYISTDSVFDGLKQGSYTENDFTSPLNIYAQTKLLGETPVLSIEKGTVLRTNIIGWSLKNRVSFSEWILLNSIKKQPIKLFKDVYFSPVHVEELSEIIVQIIDRKIYGLFHISSNDYLSKYDFGLKLVKTFGLSSEYFKSSSIHEVELKAQRPKNISLCNDKITSLLGIKLSNAENAAKIMKKQYINGYVAMIKNREITDEFKLWE